MADANLSTLESTIEQYPWFALGHFELFRKACELGEEHVRSCLSRTAAHIYSREILFNLVKRAREHNNSETQVVEEAFDEIVFEVEEEPLNIHLTSKIIMAGGDYFSKEELEETPLDPHEPLDKFICEKPSLLKSSINSRLNVDVVEEKVAEEEFDDSGFYTETLAKIYSEQGYYKKALEVYAKLILLYPEKSSYFASLAQEIKSKHNQN